MNTHSERPVCISFVSIYVYAQQYTAWGSISVDLVEFLFGIPNNIDSSMDTLIRESTPRSCEANVWGRGGGGGATTIKIHLVIWKTM